jgi:pimeloyl-ACP methyl ester carboxylesterase
VTAVGALELRRVDVAGVDTAVLVGGEGPLLLFLHGASTFPGFAFAERWTSRFRVVLPFHPGFGPSLDDPAVETLHDLRIHTLDLLDAIRIERSHVVGHSLGGWLAALLAAEQPGRVDRLVLVAPAGLDVPEHPTTDLFRVSPEKLPPLLVHDAAVLETMLPSPPTVDQVIEQYREMSTVARLLWARSSDPKLGRLLRRVRAQTLLVWGREDRITPIGQLDAWGALLPRSERLVLEHCGHLPLHEKAEAAERIAAFLSA